jgi:hypothetical protein
MTMPIPYVPVDDRGWRMAIGLRPLDLAHWLEVDDRRDEEIALKSTLLVDQRDVVVATRHEGLEASAELLDEVRRWLATYRPDLPRDVDVEEHPIVAASRLVQEDLCVLVRSDSWRLQAASVCFPSRWNLACKIGTSLDDIHQPIPQYDEKLAEPTNSVFDRMKPDRPFWRLNWTLLDRAELHQPTWTKGVARGGLPDWHFRVERQTLRQLPETRAIVFTIHNYIASLAEMIAGDAAFGVNLLRAMEEAPDAMKQYKGWLGVTEHLRSRLAEH